MAVRISEEEYDALPSVRGKREEQKRKDAARSALWEHARKIDPSGALTRKASGAMRYTIELDGEQVSRLLAGLAMIHQHFPYPDLLTIQDEVLTQVAKQSESEENADRLAEGLRAGIEEYARRKSGG